MKQGASQPGVYLPDSERHQCRNTCVILKLDQKYLTNIFCYCVAGTRLILPVDTLSKWKIPLYPPI